MKFSMVFESVDRATKGIKKIMDAEKKLAKASKAGNSKAARAARKASREHDKQRTIFKRIERAAKRAYVGITRGARSAARAVRDLYQKTKALARVPLQNIGKGLGKMKRGALIAGSAFALASGGAALAAGSMIDVASQFEKFQTILVGTEGSAAKADEAMSWVSNFAVKTPYELDAVMESFVQMRAYGIDPTNGSLRTLGDTSAAMGKPLMQAVEAMADAVTGENERLKEFGIKASKTGDMITYAYTNAAGETATATAKASDRMAIQQTLMRIWSEKFGGSMERLSQTWAGMMANISDLWLKFQLMIMQSGLFDWMKSKLASILDKINELEANGTLKEWATQIGQSIQNVLEKAWAFGVGLVSVVGRIYRVMSRIADFLGGWDRLAYILGAIAFAPSLLATAQGLFLVSKGVMMLGTALLANPIGLAVAAIVAGAVLIYFYWDEIVAFLTSTWERIKTLFSNPLSWAAVIPVLRWGGFIAKLTWGAFLAPLKWLSFVPKLAWKSAVVPFKWAGFIPRLIWTLFVSPLKWAWLLVKLSWKLFVAPLKWAAYLPKLAWKVFVTPLKWAAFVVKLSWKLFVLPLKWAAHVPKLAWKAFVAPLKWAGLLIKLSWKPFIAPLKWAAYLPKLAWKAVVSPLKWLSFLPKLSWASAVTSFKWASFVPKLSWRLLIPVLKWSARLIPGIGWALLAGELAWHLLIKPLGWAKYVSMDGLKAAWAALTSFDWSTVLTVLKWASFLTPIGWTAFIGKFAWTSVLSKIEWSNFLPSFSWSSVLKVVKWASFLTPIGWTALIGKFAWTSVLSKVEWSKFVPKMPSLSKWISGNQDAAGAVDKHSDALSKFSGSTDQAMEALSKLDAAQKNRLAFDATEGLASAEKAQQSQIKAIQSAAKAGWGNFDQGLDWLEQFKAGELALDAFQQKLMEVKSQGGDQASRATEMLEASFKLDEVTRQAEAYKQTLANIEASQKAIASTPPIPPAPKAAAVPASPGPAASPVAIKQTPAELNRISQAAKGAEASLSALGATANNIPTTVQAAMAKVRSILGAMNLVPQGQRIMQMIADGMASRAHAVVAEIQKVTQQVRDHLPASPAKTGPLSDLHRLKFIETMAQSVRPQPLVKAMAGATAAALAATAPLSNAVANAPTVANGPAVVDQAAAAARSNIGPSRAVQSIAARADSNAETRAEGGSGGGTNITYSPTIHLSGDAQSAKEDFAKMLSDHRSQIKRMVDEEMRREGRRRH